MPGQNTSSAKRRIRMRRTAVGPGGVLEAGKEYALDGNQVDALVEARAAEDLGESVEASYTTPSYQDAPFGEEWKSRGVSPSVWAEWRDSEAFEFLEKNYSRAHFSEVYDPEMSARLKDARRRLRTHLREDIEAGRIVLKIPPASPDDLAHSVSDDAIHEVIESIPFYDGYKDHEIYFRGKKVWIRLYPGRKFASRNLKPSGSPKLYTRISDDLDEQKITEDDFKPRGAKAKYVRDRAEEWGISAGSIEVKLREVRKARGWP